MESKKRKLHEEEEKIEAMAKDGKEGIENTKTILEAEQAQEAFEVEEQKELLHSERKHFVTYNHVLAQYLWKRMHLIDFPHGWTWQVAPTDQGIVLELKSPDGRFFRNAFRPAMTEKLDMNAVDLYTIRAGQTVDSWEAEYARRTKSGRAD